MTHQMIIRMDEEIKARLNRLARAEGKNTSQVIRELIQGYVTDRDIAASIDDLWGRIGKKLASRGWPARGISRVIRDVRAVHRTTKT